MLGTVLAGRSIPLSACLCPNVPWYKRLPSRWTRGHTAAGQPHRDSANSTRSDSFMHGHIPRYGGLGLQHRNLLGGCNSTHDTGHVCLGPDAMNQVVPRKAGQVQRRSQAPGACDSDFLKFDKDDGRRQGFLRPHGLRSSPCYLVRAAPRSIAVGLSSVLVETHRSRSGGSSWLLAGGQGPVQGQGGLFQIPDHRSVISKT